MSAEPSSELAHDHSQGTIRSLLTLDVRDHRVDDLVGFFKEQGILHEAVSRGCRHTELWRPVSGGGPLLVCAEWLQANDYDAWRADPVRLPWSEAMSRLTRGSDSRVYEVVHAAGRVDG